MNVSGVASPLKWCGLPPGCVDRMPSSDDEDPTSKAVLDTIYTPLRLLEAQSESSPTRRQRSRGSVGYRRKSIGRNIEANSFDILLKAHAGTECPGVGCTVCCDFVPSACSSMGEDVVENVITAIRHQILVQPKEALVVLRGSAHRADFLLTEDDASDLAKKISVVIKSAEPVVSLLAFHVLYQLCTHNIIFVAALAAEVKDTTPLRPLLREASGLGLGWVSETEEDEDDVFPNVHHGVTTCSGMHSTTHLDPAPEDAQEKMVVGEIITAHYTNAKVVLDMVSALRAAGADFDQIYRFILEADPSTGFLPQAKALKEVGFDMDRFPAPSKEKIDRSLYCPWVFTLDSLPDALRGDITEADFLQIEEDFRKIDVDNKGVIDLSTAAALGAKIGYGNMCSLNMFKQLGQRTKTVSLLQILTTRFADIPPHFLHRRMNQEPVPDNALELSTNPSGVRHASLFLTIDTKLRQVQRAKGKFVLNFDVVLLVKKWFDLYDVDRTGDITYHELEMQGGLIGEVSLDVKVFKRMDKNRSGGMSMVELVRTLFPQATPAQFKPFVDGVINKSQEDWDAKIRRKKECEDAFNYSIRGEMIDAKNIALFKFAVEKAGGEKKLVNPVWLDCLKRMKESEATKISLQECVACMYPTLTPQHLDGLRLLLPRPLTSPSSCECFCCGGSLSALGFFYPKSCEPCVAPPVAAMIQKLATFAVNADLPTERLVFLFPDSPWPEGTVVPFLDVLMKVFPDEDVVQLQYAMAMTVKLTNPLSYLAKLSEIQETRQWGDDAMKESMRVATLVRRTLAATDGRMPRLSIGGYWVTLRHGGNGHGGAATSAPLELFEVNLASRHRRATMAFQAAIHSKETSFLQLATCYALLPNFTPDMSAVDAIYIDSCAPKLTQPFQRFEINEMSPLEQSFARRRSRMASLAGSALVLEASIASLPFLTMDAFMQRPSNRWACVALLQLLEDNGCDTAHVVDPRLQFLYRGKPLHLLLPKTILSWDSVTRDIPTHNTFQIIVVCTSLVAQRDQSAVFSIKSSNFSSTVRVIVISKKKNFLAASYAVDETGCFVEVGITPGRGLAFRVTTLVPSNRKDLLECKMSIQSSVACEFHMVSAK